MSTQHQKLGIKKKTKRKAGAKDEWATPPALFEWVAQYYNFTLDAAATKKNKLCPKYYSAKQNALKKNWFKGAKGGDCWLNHPYSQNKQFIEKCFKESLRGLNICNLGPADTSTDYFAMYREYCTAIYLISGRIKFVGATSAATFASAFYCFGEDKLSDDHNKKYEKIVLLEGLSAKVRGGFQVKQKLRRNRR